MTDVAMAGERAARVGEWRGVHVVVFVHGLGGDYHETWGEFPELVATDPDLPALDILLWGYRSSFVAPNVQDTETLGRNLVSELRVHLVNGVSACLVAHSMGGLVVLEGLVGEMKRGRAQEHPVNGIDLLSLFAVPTSGSSLADAAVRIVGRLGLPKAVLNKQVRSLTGEVCDTLLAEVVVRIYDPPGESAEARRIPIRVVVASGDRVVDETDSDMTATPFQNPPALEFDYDHASVKLPSSHHDARYLALAQDLQEVMAQRFMDMARRFEAEEADGDGVVEEIETRYGELLRRRLVDAGYDPAGQPRIYAGFRAGVIRDCAEYGRPIFEAANRAATILRESPELLDFGG